MCTVLYALNSHAVSIAQARAETSPALRRQWYACAQQWVRHALALTNVPGKPSKAQRRAMAAQAAQPTCPASVIKYADRVADRVIARCAQLPAEQARRLAEYYCVSYSAAYLQPCRAKVAALFRA